MKMSKIETAAMGLFKACAEDRFENPKDALNALDPERMYTLIDLVDACLLADLYLSGGEDEDEDEDFDDEDFDDEDFDDEDEDEPPAKPAKRAPAKKAPAKKRR